MPPTPPPDKMIYYFPFIFGGFWLFISTLLSFIAGWFHLMGQFPDREEKGNLLNKHKHLSAGMGPGAGVSMRGILTIEIYERGLRLKINRLFGPFDKPLFIPWESLRVERGKMFLVGDVANFLFGKGGKLILRSDMADILRRDAGKAWPEPGPVPEPPPPSRILKKILLWWVIYTALGSAFFIAASRSMLSGNSKWKAEDLPPIVVCVLFPATVMGLGAAFEYRRKTSVK